MSCTGASVGWMSTGLKDLTGPKPVPIPDAGAGHRRNLSYIVEQDVRVAYPGVEQDLVDRRVTEILADPGKRRVPGSLRQDERDALHGSEITHAAAGLGRTLRAGRSAHLLADADRQPSQPGVARLDGWVVARSAHPGAQRRGGGISTPST